MGASLCRRRHAGGPCFVGAAGSHPHAHPVACRCSPGDSQASAAPVGDVPDFRALRPAQLGLWMLQSCELGAGPEALLMAGAELLRRREAEALSLAMGTWALATAGAMDVAYFKDAAERMTAGMDQVALLPRAPEALANTAKAYARLFQASPEAAGSMDVTSLFTAMAAVAVQRRGDFTLDQCVVLSQSSAVVGARVLPFGVTAPAAEAVGVHSALAQLRGAELLFQEPQGFRVAQVDDFMTQGEISEILTLAEPLWRPSKTYEGEPSVRTSDTANFRGDTASTPAVLEVARRAAALVGLPGDRCETLQLVRYESEAHYYREHFDLLDDVDQLLLGGQRLATVLVYLSSLPEEAGGETFFPEIGEEGLKVSPKCGSAVVWPNVDVAGEPQRLSRHAALPLSPGGKGHVKYAVNCWIRAFPGASSL